MYALVEIKGKQYRAEKGASITVDKLDNDSGENCEFDSVLFLNNDGTVKVGSPYVKGAKVAATVVSHKKDKKVIVYKFKRRKGYRRKQGHRQNYSVIKIDDIVTASSGSE